jgi:polyisoprenoid-binding protein YceI
MTFLSRVPRPRSRRACAYTLSAIVLAVAAAFAAVYFLLFSGSAPAPLALSSGTGASSTPVPTPAVAGVQVPGTWSVAAGSVVGYRVREQLAFLSAPSDAVGRTSSVTGSVTIGGTDKALTVTAATFTVDVSKLSSDQSMRDQHIRTLGVQSDTYPKATFVLAAPVTLPTNVASGAAVSVSVTGAMTIHGTTKTVTIPMTARLSAKTTEVVGSITFPFEEFGMTPPSIGGFVSVQDNATMEFDLHLQQA